MKIILTIVLLITSFSGAAFSQNKMTEFNVGLLAPADAESGFFGGINLGRMVDEKIGISLGVHVYHSSYVKESKVGEDDGTGQITTSQRATELDQSATLLPFYFQLHYTGPITQLLDLKVTAGLGYELLWNSITNFKEGKERTDFFSGFGWNVAAGISIPISSASDFYGEVLYHGGTPSSDEGKTDEGLPLRTEVDMSGLGVHIGIRLYTFGL